jgi:circadian clock protein KaiC
MKAHSPERAPSGIAGLDQILGGGFPRNRIYLVSGPPGSGKTTLALRFLMEGRERGESGIYVALSETDHELRDVASSHGWSLEGLSICDLQNSQESLKADSQYTFFHPSEVELSETTRTLLAEVDRVKPLRVVFDSLSEMRLLARDSLRYRRQVLALKQYFSERSCTVLLLDTVEPGSNDEFQLESIAHGVLVLQQLAPEYGGERRRLRFVKLRGLKFRDGWHDYKIRTGGMEVFPRLIASEQAQVEPGERARSGVAELDEMLGGGLDRGTSALFLGPAGVGKSTLTMQYVRNEVARGRRACAYIFDESRTAWLLRSDGLQLGLRKEVESGRVVLRQVDPAELSPGEFAHMVRADVDATDARLVVIDSLNGYQTAMPQEKYLLLHLHELLTYLGHRGVLTLMVMAQHGIVGDSVQAPLELSYVADTVILLRYFEAFGVVRQAVAAVKKRTGGLQRSVRELRIGPPAGVRLGRELAEFSGVLAGDPAYRGAQAPLFEEHGNESRD